MLSPILSSIKSFPLSKNLRMDSSIVDDDITKSIEVDAQYLVAFHKIRSHDGIFDIHREIASYGKNGQIEFGSQGNQFHVHRQGGVAGNVRCFCARPR